MLEAQTSETCQMMLMSNHSEFGVSKVKTTACDLLLEQRVDRKLASKATDPVLNRLHVAVPTSRDATSRKPNIPASVRIAREPHHPHGSTHLHRRARGTFALMNTLHQSVNPLILVMRTSLDFLSKMPAWPIATHTHTRAPGEHTRSQ